MFHNGNVDISGLTNLIELSDYNQVIANLVSKLQKQKLDVFIFTTWSGLQNIRY
ncbi:hypothetical protein [Francisella salimarina]|uniref:hypothetical protein n=1 Tax=Francisella salimarina TaxID=2599927 RepID=UPI003D819DE7